MSAEPALIVDHTLSIARPELFFRATRAGGPGGQHVNTSATRIELLWNVRQSRSISEEQRARLVKNLGSRLDAAGNLRLVASAFRSQLRNRQDAEERLVATVRRGLHVPRARRKTRPPRAAVQSRLRSKRLRSERKRQRRSAAEDE